MQRRCMQECPEGWGRSPSVEIDMRPEIRTKEIMCNIRRPCVQAFQRRSDRRRRAIRQGGGGSEKRDDMARNVRRALILPRFSTSSTTTTYSFPDIISAGALTRDKLENIMSQMSRYTGISCWRRVQSLYAVVQIEGGLAGDSGTWLCFLQSCSYFTPGKKLCHRSCSPLGAL